MSIKIEKISKDFIKPSTPTPDHLRRFNLSFIDQIFPLSFVPVILFYTKSATLDAVSDQLKKSLSKTLTNFYPLAGRIKDNILVDCNDEGIEYFESRINGNISDFMKRDQLHHLLPYEFHSTLNVMVNDSLLIVQLNLFDCGGIAISVCISHKIADAAALTTFINSWAYTTRNEQGILTEKSIILNPAFDSSVLFPPREGISSYFSAGQAQVQVQKTVTKRFVFVGTKIATLRARYGCLTTRVVAVAALIWKTKMAIASSLSEQKPSVANIIVDMRKRFDPPLSEQSFGNLTMLTTAAPSITENGEVDLVSPLKESIRKINCDSLKILQGDEGFLRFQEYMDMAMGMHENLDVHLFTSWCRFPLYEVDFGWGKPNWVAVGSQPFQNTSVLMDNSRGDGIEAWICLREKEMAMFERDQELLEFISFLD